MTMQSPDTRPPIFDQTALSQRRDRAMALGFADRGAVLHDMVADVLSERLDMVTRRFEEAALIGAGAGRLMQALEARSTRLRTIEASPARATATGAEAVASLEPLPLQAGAHDLVVSALELHWANDPVGQLIQMRRALRPDGLLLAALFGGQTLSELRAALASAEADVTGGLSPRVAPMAEIRDLGALLQRAGLVMPVADAERVTLTYADPLALMRDLRLMGETNILAARPRTMMRRDVLARAVEHYATLADSTGRVPATFEVIVLTGWSPGPDQPVAKRPGSATARMADALQTDEFKLPE